MALAPSSLWKRRGLMAMALIVTVGCVGLGIVIARRGPTAGLTDAHEMKRAIREHVPIGTAIEEAKAFMEAEGFRCDREHTNQMFTGDGETRVGLDFVLCERSEPAGILEVRFWHVALVVAEEKVTEILVDTAVFGL